MLSSKLIQLIEDHWDPITTCILREIHRDPRLKHASSLPASDLRERAREILEHLGQWLSEAHPREIEERCERIGRLRFEEEIPLREAVLAQLIIKERLIDFVRQQGIADSPVAIYAEEELEHCVGRFFDNMIYHVMLGYEDAQEASHVKVKRAAARG